MACDRNQLPPPADYYRDSGLRLNGAGKWRTSCCAFCECRDTMRVNLDTGAFCCRDCGASGGDVLEYHMELTGADVIQAAKALGAWVYSSLMGAALPQNAAASHGI